MLTDAKLQELSQKAARAAHVVDPYSECWDPDCAADVPDLLAEIERLRTRLDSEGLAGQTALDCALIFQKDVDAARVEATRLREALAQIEALDQTAHGLVIGNIARAALAG